MKDLRDYKANGYQYAYILDCINSEDVELTTDKQRIEYFFRMFSVEGDCEYKRRMYPNEQERIEQYLRGLPSCCGIAYENHVIIEIGRSWGCSLDTERKEDEFCERWFSVMAFRLMQIRDRYINN